MSRDSEDNINQHLDARMSRRVAAENRMLTRLEKREKEAKRLVNETVKDGKPVYSINQLNRKGVSTGKTREFPSEGAAIAFLLRNGYV